MMEQSIYIQARFGIFLCVSMNSQILLNCIYSFENSLRSLIVKNEVGPSFFLYRLLARVRERNSRNRISISFATS